MTEADKMLEEVGFKPITLVNPLYKYESNETYIRFRTDENKVYVHGNLTMEQLKAINEKCKELKMVVI